MQRTLQRFLLVVLLIAMSSPAFSEGNTGLILRADVDVASGLLFINGLGLNARELSGKAPTVVLGSTSLEVVSFSRTDIVANVPPDLAPATYFLSVGGDLHFAVSVGDIGLQGPPGPKGDTGP